MKSLPLFKMEQWLEEHRFSAHFNMGESGARPRTVGELLRLSGVKDEHSAQLFLNMPLHDSPNWGRSDLRQLIAQMHPGADIDNILITTGTSEALFLLMRQLRPQKIAMLSPAFQLLHEIPEALNAEIIALPVCWDAHGAPQSNWNLWFNILETKQPDVLLFNHPHNPSGLCFSELELDTLIGFCEIHKITLVADEHYRFLTESTQKKQSAQKNEFAQSSNSTLFTSQLGPTLFRQNKSIYCTGSYIKCVGAPGLRIGWCVGNTDVLSAMQNEKNYTTHTVNPIAEWISLEVLKNLESGQLFQNILAEWNQNKLLLNEFVNSHGCFWNCTAPQGGLVCALLPKMTMPLQWETAAFRKLIAAGIFLLPLSTFRNAPQGFRLGLGIEPKLFKNALMSLKNLD